jgi:aldehyde dehydrogenase (NAD+)
MAAAKQFFDKAMGANGDPRKVAMDKSGANKAAIDAINAGRDVSILVRQVKFLNNIIEQDHRATKPVLNFKSFRAAGSVLAGIELIHMIRKGQFSISGVNPISFADQFSTLAEMVVQFERVSAVSTNRLLFRQFSSHYFVDAREEGALDKYIRWLQLSAGSGNLSSAFSYRMSWLTIYHERIGSTRNSAMKTINTIYINGKFVAPHGREELVLVDPATERETTTVVLADEIDARRAIAAAKAAMPSFARKPRALRMHWLQRLHDVVAGAEDDITDIMVAEYGGTQAMARGTAKRAAASFAIARRILADYAFEREVGGARVVMVPHGVVGMITPWNANIGFIASKLSMALAAGSTAVIKPSELSAAQTALFTRLLDQAGLPPGVVNIVTGRGDSVGAEITRHPDIAKISFTGSTAVGKAIARGAVDTLKRVTLELGGKSPMVLLDDADFAKVMPLAAMAAVMNNGQACIAGTRLLVPHSRIDEAHALAVSAFRDLVVGPTQDPRVNVGPLVTRQQYERVQAYIQTGIQEGATLLAGGPGRPEGLDRGWFIRPTVFGHVTNDMVIAREEIFGPVLSIIGYRDDDDAIAIANDTSYGLQAYVFGTDLARANRVAADIVAGRVFVNGLYDAPEAPFGGFKQSGLGREFGLFGFEAYLEPKTMIGHDKKL